MDTHQQKSNQVALSSLESFDHATKKDHGWFHVEWFMGRRCNYDCSYCSALEHDNISPHVKFEDIQNAHIHSIYLINTDKGFSKELDPKAYLQMTKSIIEKSEIDI